MKNGRLRIAAGVLLILAVYLYGHQAVANGQAVLAARTGRAESSGMLTLAPESCTEETASSPAPAAAGTAAAPAGDAAADEHSVGSAGSGAEDIRRTAPLPGAAGSQYYYDAEMNPFYPRFAPGYERADGYVTGNCTWYAWGRVCEMAGRRLPRAFSGSAGEWWQKNRKENSYAYGQVPRRGAIICYETHVAVVEQAKPLIVSESGWQVEPGGHIVFHCGTPWRQGEKIFGYIYPDSCSMPDQR